MTQMKLLMLFDVLALGLGQGAVENEMPGVEAKHLAVGSMWKTSTALPYKIINKSSKVEVKGMHFMYVLQNTVLYCSVPYCTVSGYVYTNIHSVSTFWTWLRSV